MVFNDVLLYARFKQLMQEKPNRFRKFIYFTHGGYWIGLFIMYALITWGGDRHWLGTLLLYGPRWVSALPWIPLAIVTIALARKWLLSSALQLIALGLITDLHIPISRVFAQTSPAHSIRIMSLNTQGGSRLAELQALLTREQPNIVFLQEWDTQRARSHTAFSGYTLYEQENAAFLSQYPISDIQLLHREQMNSNGVVVKALAHVNNKTLQLVNVHLDTARWGIEALLGGRLAGIVDMEQSLKLRAEQSRLVREWMGTPSIPTIIAGDLNLPEESMIYKKFWNDFDNAFCKSGFGWGYTKITRKFGVRIDHILYDSHFQSTHTWVGENAGSDHRPIIADLKYE